MATELVLAEVARSLGKPLLEVQEANFYKDGDRTPYGQVGRGGGREGGSEGGREGGREGGDGVLGVKPLSKRDPRSQFLQAGR